MERWNGIAGTPLSGLFSAPAFPQSPSTRGFVTSATITPNQGDNYGLRLRGWVTAPVTGNYRFHISADDQARLYLGTTASRFSARQICQVTSWVSPGNYTSQTGQQSALIPLVAGQSYYIEAFSKEGASGDHLSVAWTLPGATALQVIPGRLANGTVVLTSETPDAADLDDDGNADTWETAQGLNPASAVDHAWRDLDADSFDNRVESLTGGSALQVGGNQGFCEWRSYMIGSNQGKISNLTGHPLFAQDTAAFSGFFTTPEADQNAGNGFGRRIRGVITIPTTGTYHFYLASDDAGVLMLNPSGVSRFGKSLAAYCHANVGYRSFTTHLHQKSKAYSLTVGQKLYFEILYVEQGGSDHASLAWTGPGIASPTVLPSTAISNCGLELKVTGSSTVNNDTDNDSLPDDWELAHGLSVGNTGNSAVANSEYGDPDGDGITNFEEYRQGSHPLTAAGLAGKWTQEIFAAVGGGRVPAMLGANGLLREPDVIRQVTSPEEFQNQSENFGQRLRATFKAPITGPYRFWITGDDGAELWISIDDRKFRKRRIATIDDVNIAMNYAGFRDWDRVPGQRSSLIELVAGEEYFIEILHSDSAGSDHCSVAWNFASNLPADGYISTASAGTLIFPSITPSGGPSFALGDVIGVSGAMKGGWIPTTTPAQAYHFVNNANVATFQLQFKDASYTKVVKLQMEETWEGTFVRQVYAKYKSGDHLGADFDTISGASSAPIGSAGYGVVALTLNGVDGPLAAMRDVIPAGQFTSYVRDATDSDDDYLADTWENQYLGAGASADNGRVNPNLGEYGDPDGDSLINRVEWLLGTHPGNADTDGDGYSDGQEVFFLGTNPLVPELEDPQVIGEASITEHVGASGNWVETAEGGILSMENRGWIDYEVDVAADGFYLFEIVGRARGSNITAREDFPLDVWVDSRKVANTVLTSLQGQQGLAAGFVGWLEAGTHTIRVWNANLLARRTLQLDSLRLVLPSGPSSIHPGLPDWVYDLLSSKNSLVTTTTSSFTSPFCLEGIARDWSTTAVSINWSSFQPVSKGTGNGWYLDIPLDPDLSVLLDIRFENQLLSQEHGVEWTPFNVASGLPLKIRVGDRLRLTAYTPGGTPGTSTVSLTRNGQSLGSTAADEPLITEFPTAGIFTIAASYDDGNGPQTASVQVEVVAANLGPVLPVYLNRSRTWDLPGLPPAVPLAMDSTVLLSGRTTLGAGSRFTVDVTRRGTNTVLARTQEDGAVVAAGQVEGILLSHSSNYELPVVHTYPNGDRIVELTVFASQLPPGGYVRLEIWLGGRLFLPSGTTSIMLTAADFGEDGIAKVRMLLSSGTGTTCHRTYLHAADGSLIGQM
ncbi:MAG: PA14 domain-containing protein [Akkermansiaceae bacterium]|nr:PA14 domain-containing protein [Akkermansiaceae bacterium]